MNKEIITRFLHEEMSFKENITCHNFTLNDGKNLITIELKDGYNILMFRETIKLERYNQWLREERGEKLNQLVI